VADHDRPRPSLRASTSARGRPGLDVGDGAGRALWGPLFPRRPWGALDGRRSAPAHSPRQRGPPRPTAGHRPEPGATVRHEGRSAPREDEAGKGSSGHATRGVHARENGGVQGRESRHNMLHFTGKVMVTAGDIDGLQERSGSPGRPRFHFLVASLVPDGDIGGEHSAGWWLDQILKSPRLLPACRLLQEQPPVGGTDGSPRFSTTAVASLPR